MNCSNNNISTELKLNYVGHLYLSEGETYLTEYIAEDTHEVLKQAFEQELKQLGVE